MKNFFREGGKQRQNNGLAGSEPMAHDLWLPHPFKKWHRMLISRLSLSLLSAYIHMIVWNQKQNQCSHEQSGKYSQFESSRDGLHLKIDVESQSPPSQTASYQRLLRLSHLANGSPCCVYKSLVPKWISTWLGEKHSLHLFLEGSN